jgi:predicted GNAT family acetyltransferase
MKPTKDELAEMYLMQRMSTREIGVRLGVAHITVGRWLKANGIPVRSADKGLANRGIEPPSRDDLYRMIHVEHLGYRGVAKRFGVDHTAIPHWLKRHGIARPTWTQSKYKGAFPELDAAEIGRLYDAGMSSAAIAERMNVSSDTIRRACRKRGIAVRPDGFRNGARYACESGLLVRSAYEKRVADWLSQRSIPYEYEPALPFRDRPFAARLRGDFLANGWYIEVWGVVGSASYQAKKERKLDLYRSHGLPLIQLSPYHFARKYAGTLAKRLGLTLMPPAQSRP